MMIEFSSKPRKDQQLSLRESGKWDHEHKTAPSGWTLVCKNRTGENSASQRRKRNRKLKG